MREWIYHGWYWIVTVVSVSLHFLIGLLCYITPHPQINHRKLARFFIKRIAAAIQLRVVVHGLSHIPPNTPIIFMANHTSLIDILVMIIGLPCHFNFIAKKELRWVPLIGLDMIMEGDFLIDRRNPKAAKLCLKKVESRLKKGGNILIFPEGTRSKNGTLLPFKLGGFRLATASGATIVPCYIYGANHIVQKQSLKASPGTVHIHIGQPIDPTKIDASDDLPIRLMVQTQQHIADLKMTVDKDTSCG
jgi:1-acyl-sn-glycerol-3-phosphate acyltransferase